MVKMDINKFNPLPGIVSREAVAVDFGATIFNNAQSCARWIISGSAATLFAVGIFFVSSKSSY